MEDRSEIFLVSRASEGSISWKVRYWSPDAEDEEKLYMPGTEICAMWGTFFEMGYHIWTLQRKMYPISWYHISKNVPHMPTWHRSGTDVKNKASGIEE